MERRSAPGTATGYRDASTTPPNRATHALLQDDAAADALAELLKGRPASAESTTGPARSSSVMSASRRGAEVADVTDQILEAAEKAAKEEHSEEYFFEHFDTFVPYADDRHDLKEAVERARKSRRWPWKPGDTP